MFNALFDYTEQHRLLQFLVWLGFLLSIAKLYLRAIFPTVLISNQPFASKP
jgi:hypothetical protein